MSTIGTLIENIMSAGAVNIAPIKLSSFHATVGKKLVFSIELQNGIGNFFEIGRTGEVLCDVGPVDLKKRLQIPYQFSDVQRLKVVAYDVTAEENADIKEAGRAILTLGKVISSQKVKAEFSNNIGCLEVETEQVTDCRSVVFDICAEKLEKKDLFGKSDPFLEISRKDDDGQWRVVHRTEHVKETLNPHWSEFTLSHQLLCDNDTENDVKFACYDFDRSGNHDLIGEAFITPSQILGGNSAQTFALANTKKKQKKKGIGRLTIKKCKVKKDPSFISYMLAGCQLHLTCGIDFTGSNGDPQQNSSLHYTGSTNPNKYVLSLQAIGRILQEYTSEKKISVYGFGAKIPPNKEVSHDFALNQDSGNAVIAGMDELLSAYQKTLNTVKLWGPTNFAPIITKVADAAEACDTGRLNYHILLILTDGVVTDMADTKRAIVRASKLPVSIIIVGIGNADFGEMDFLNNRSKLVKSPDGETASRHIVKCVTFRNFNFSSMDTLARNLLNEIPFQAIEYFTIHGIDPKEEKDNSGEQTSSVHNANVTQEADKTTNETQNIANSNVAADAKAETKMTKEQSAERARENTPAEEISVF